MSNSFIIMSFHCLNAIDFLYFKLKQYHTQISCKKGTPISNTFMVLLSLILTTKNSISAWKYEDMQVIITKWRKETKTS